MSLRTALSDVSQWQAHSFEELTLSMLAYYVESEERAKLERDLEGQVI